MVKSRPDISYAVSWGATKAVHPTQSDFSDLLRVLCFLYYTQNKGLILKKIPRLSHLILTCYVDASYLSHIVSKSQTGYCMSFFDSGSFYSKSSKQTIVTTSSAHTELRALYHFA